MTGAAPKPFQKVNVEISNICNLQCSFCPEVERPHGMMTEALFTEVVKQVSPLTEQICFHLMGDPLVHPRLERLLDLCEAAQVKVFFVTNGVLLRDDRKAALLHPALRQVNFSLHSFFDNFPDGDPSSYLERIFSYVERALAERPDLYLNFRLWNLKDPRGADTRNSEMLERIRARFPFELSATDVRRKKGHRIQGKLYLHFDTEFTWPSLALPELGENGRCYGLSSHFGILVDGTVVPCCLDKEGLIPLGKIQERPIAEILGSTRAQAMLQGFRERRLVEELCKRCSYIDRFGRA